jgi:hypothetical protein
MELIEFADVEALVIEAITDDFTTSNPGVPAATKVPNPRPEEFIRVIRAGGPRETLISENAFVLVEAWAATEARAVKLLNRARAVLFAQDGALFGVTEIGGPSNLPDPTTSQVRYTSTLGVRARGTATA